MPCPVANAIRQARSGDHGSQDFFNALNTCFRNRLAKHRCSRCTVKTRLPEDTIQLLCQRYRGKFQTRFCNTGGSSITRRAVPTLPFKLHHVCGGR
jgi:hypothetical protein